MKNLKWWYVLILLLHSLPYLALFAVGFLWLWEHPGGLWIWGGCSAVTLVSGTFLLRAIRSRNATVPRPMTQHAQSFTEAEPDPDWPPQATAAWRDVERLAERLRKNPPNLDQAETYWQLFYQVINTVAKQYHPNREEPALEIPAPQVLRTAELVSRDVRKAITENIPGSHLLTLGDFRRLQRWKTLGQRAYFLYRLASFGFNPAAAAVREIRGTATNQVLATSGTDLKEWLVDFSIRKTGYYAIGLYGEHQSEEDLPPESQPTTFSIADVQQHEEAQAEITQRLQKEPLRLLVIGRRGSGKTSLMAELTGSTVVAPGTEHKRITTFWNAKRPEPTLFDMPTDDETSDDELSTESNERILVIELPGYTSRDQVWKKTEEEVVLADMILLTCSAIAKDYGPEHMWIEKFRQWTEAHPERHPPVLLVAMTKAERLAEIAEEPLSPAQLTEAIVRQRQTLRQSLQLHESEVVCVTNVTAECVTGIQNGRGLLPTIQNLLGDARKVRKYRCLRLQHTEGRVRRVANQVKSGVGLAASIGSTLLSHAFHKRTSLFGGKKEKTSPTHKDEEW